MAKKSNNKSRLVLLRNFIPMAVLLIFAIFCVWYLGNHNIQVLNPKGDVARSERALMAFTVLLGSLVVIPVFIITIFIAWRYRETGKGKYTPDAKDNRIIEFIWWAIPIVIIAILGTVTWISTYRLDPYKSLTVNSNALKIQVVSLDWKWLFIYPDQNIATVNFIQFPVDQPVHFNITSDTVMNSLWIPQLSGQIYTMPGMTTQLNIQAGSPGDYDGVSANISGKGFAGMRFTARASSRADFNNWVRYAKQSDQVLNSQTYEALAKPSENNKVTYYSSADPKLFNDIIAKYMMPMDSMNKHGDSSMDMSNMHGDSHSKASSAQNDYDKNPHQHMNMDGMDMNMNMDMSPSGASQ